MTIHAIIPDREIKFREFHQAEYVKGSNKDKKAAEVLHFFYFYSNLGPR